MDARRLRYWLNLLSIEGEVAEAYDGLEPGDNLVFVEDLYGTE